MPADYTKSIEGEVLVEQVRHLYGNAPRSVPFNIINPLILLVVFWPVTEGPTLVSWFAAMTALSLARLLHVFYVIRRPAFFKSPSVLARHFIIGSTATAALWSTGFIAIGLSLPLVHLTLFLLVLGGMAAGAFTSLGTHRTAYLWFLGGMFLPVVVKLLLLGSPIASVLTVFVLMFSIMLALTHRVSYQILVDGIRDRIENQHLVKRLERANSRLEIANAELGTRAETDSLTGIGNRRYFEQRLTLEWLRARRERRVMACVMIDLDYFKAFNDHYGHSAGDECLKRVAESLDNTVKRATDVLARFGGEEFIVLLPDTSMEDACFLAEKFRVAIADLAIAHEAASDSGYVSASLGVAAVVPQRLSGKHALVNAADDALYAAKSKGRNTVVAGEAPTAAAPSA